MIGFVVELVLQLRAVIGCRYLTLDSQPHLVPWYESQGFVQNREEQKARRKLAEERGRPVADLPVSMRYDLRDRRDYSPPEDEAR